MVGMKDKQPYGWKKVDRGARLYALLGALVWTFMAWSNVRLIMRDGPAMDGEVRFICYLQILMAILFLLEFLLPWRPDPEMPRGCLLEGGCLLLISLCCGVGGIFIPWGRPFYVGAWVIVTAVPLAVAAYYFWKYTKMKNQNKYEYPEK